MVFLADLNRPWYNAGYSIDFLVFMHSTHQLEVLENVLEALSACIFWKNANCTYCGCSKEASKFFGLSQTQEIIGKTDGDLSFLQKHAALRSAWQQADDLVLETGQSQSSSSLINWSNNQELSIRSTHAPIFDKHGQISGIAVNVLERKVVESQEVTPDKKSADQKEKVMFGYLQSIMACVPGNLFLKDTKGRYLMVNDFCLKFFQAKSTDEIIGKTDEELLGSDQAKVPIANDKKVIATGKTVKVEEEMITPEGEKKVFLNIKVPLRDQNDNIIGVAGNAIDITDKKRAEALEKAALEHENALNAMRVETINRFCRKLLHDIRSPLSTLRMLITVLCKATLDGDSTVDLVRIRATAYRCIRRIEAMANSFLRKYRQQANEEELPPEPTLLMPLVVDALLEKRSTLSMEDIKLQQEMKGAHSLSSAVECFELVQIFSNLINNCAEAIVEKREKIGDKKAEGLVRFKMTEQKEHIHFAISDNGCGIPQNLLEDIFQKDKTTKKEGSGIGLFHAREGIDSWGGKIWAESKEGEGSTMNILLPKSEAPPDWFAPQIEIKKNGILAVVDDEPHLYYSMKKLIEEQGLTEDIHLVEIKTLPKFDEWYEEHKDQNPVILMDYLFYNEQRRTGLDAIKENEAGNAIIVTNIYDDVFLRKECTDAGVQLIPKNIIDRIPILVK